MVWFTFMLETKYIFQKSVLSLLSSLLGGGFDLETGIYRAPSLQSTVSTEHRLYRAPSLQSTVSKPISAALREKMPQQFIHFLILMQLNPCVELSAYAKHFLFPSFRLFTPAYKLSIFWRHYDTYRFFTLDTMTQFFYFPQFFSPRHVSGSLSFTSARWTGP